MTTYKFQYVRLTAGDKDIPFLKGIHKLPEIARFIRIDDPQYFYYVTGTENAYYFKVILEQEIVASVHLEKQYDTLYISILTVPKYQNRGIAAQVLIDIKSMQILQGFSRIIASIDKENTYSIRLFEDAGFIFHCKADELLEYHLNL